MFSNITIVETIDKLLKLDTHDKINSFLIKYNLPISHSHTYGISRKKNDIAKFLIENPDKKGILRKTLSEEIILDIIEDYLNKNKERLEFLFFESNPVIFTECPRLENYLLKDGFKIEDGKIERIIPSEIDIVEKENALIKLLRENNFNEALGHYEEAQNSFSNGNWAACNSQIRTYVESLIHEMAAKLNNNNKFDTTNNAMIYLAKPDINIFRKDLNEYSDQGSRGFIQGFWNRLHPEGSHPGLSNQDDSSFRFNLVIITTMELLRRYKSKIKTEGF